MITSVTDINLSHLHHNRPVSVALCSDHTGACLYLTGDGGREEQANLDLDAMILLRRALDTIIALKLARRCILAGGVA